MWRAFVIVFLAAASISAMPPETPASKVEYKTKDGSRMIIIAVKKTNQEAGQESTVGFYSPQNEKLCSLDFSSEDGEHGFSVVKAAWTPDEKYSVFSLTSSGGHQSWHAPTLFYGVHERKIHSLDAYIVAAGISKGNFALESPNTVLTEVWEEKSVAVKFSLDSLTKDRRKSRHTLLCASGKVFQVDPYDLQNHD
jgi:hypothetical protein